MATHFGKKLNEQKQKLREKKERENNQDHVKLKSKVHKKQKLRGKRKEEKNECTCDA
jgi:hypothetical protein